MRSDWNFFYEEIKDDLKQKNFVFEKIEEVSEGKNSKSFCLFLSKKKYLLKFFPRNELNVRDRLNSELKFLKFLNDIGYENIPKPIFWNHKKKFIVISWLDGKKIKKVTHSHVKKLIDFILSIQKNIKSKYSYEIGNASEAYFLLSHHAEHIKKRISLLVLQTQGINIINNNKLLLQKLIRKITEEYELILDNNLYKRTILEDKNESNPIISPSDIGFHNVLVDKFDQLLFFDFEYAG